MGARWLIFTLALFMAAACSQAANQPEFPYFDSEGGRVRDEGQILSDATEKRLDILLANAERDYGQQMAVVSVKSLRGYQIEDFSLLYARSWGLGDKVRNDGLLLLVAPTERKVRIEVGRGIEATFSDVYCKEVIDLMLPYFKDNAFDEGVVAGAEELVRQMQLNPSLPANDNHASLERKAA